MRKIIIIGLIASCGIAQSGIEDYLIYDRHNRNNLNELDAIVEIKVNHIYAFSYPDLIHNYVHESNRIMADIKTKGRELHGTATPYWISTPDWNAQLHLSIHTVWVVDADIQRCLDGICETNKILVALKNTSASFEGETLPHCITKEESTFLGIVQIGKEEFQRAFRDKLCYLKDDLDFIEKTRVRSVDHCLDYNRTFDAYGSASFWVARDIGVQKQAGNEAANPVTNNVTNLEPLNLQTNSLMQELKRSQTEEQVLMKKLKLNEPLSSPHIAIRINQLKKMMMGKVYEN